MIFSGILIFGCFMPSIQQNARFASAARSYARAEKPAGMTIFPISLFQRKVSGEVGSTQRWKSTFLPPSSSVISVLRRVSNNA